MDQAGMKKQLGQVYQILCIMAPDLSQYLVSEKGIQINVVPSLITYSTYTVCQDLAWIRTTNLPIWNIMQLYLNRGATPISYYQGAINNTQFQEYAGSINKVYSILFYFPSLFAYWTRRP
jgi:hypothetical protein